MNEAQQQLVIDNLKLVPYTFHTFFKRKKGLEQELMDAGLFGLINAAKTFETNKGAKFSTYAVECIRNAMNHRLVYINTNKEQFFRKSLSLDYEYSGDQPRTLHDFFPGAFMDRRDRMKEVEDKLLVEQLLSCLNEREYQFIVMHYGLNGHKPLMQREIQKKMGITFQRVGQIIQSGIKKMRKELQKAAIDSNEKICTFN